jgi:hypothetical protein
MRPFAAYLAAVKAMTLNCIAIPLSQKTLAISTLG